MCQEEVNIENSKLDDGDILYKSSELILNVCMDEYSKERERSERFDNKSGLFITALVTLLTIYMQIIPFEGIKDNYKNSYKVNEMTIFLCILVLAIIFFIMSFIMFIISLSARTYKRVNIDDLKKEEINSQNSDIMALSLNKHYIEIINYNRKINNKKLKYWQNGMIFTLISFLLLLISNIGIFIIIK